MTEYINKAELKQAVRDKWQDLETRVEVNCIVNEMPTIDIVHCMHCKYHYENGWCRNPRWENFDFMVCTPDMFFCADGKRRSDE